MDPAQFHALFEELKDSKYVNLSDARKLIGFAARHMGDNKLDELATPESYICSTYVDRILSLSSNTMCLGNDVIIAMPGHFASSYNFEDYDLKRRCVCTDPASENVQPTASAP